MSDLVSCITCGGPISSNIRGNCPHCGEQYPYTTCVECGEQINMKDGHYLINSWIGNSLDNTLYPPSFASVREWYCGTCAENHVDPPNPNN